MMLRRYLSKRPGIILNIERSYCTPRWDLTAAVCVERKPAITPPPSDLQRDFGRYLAAVEYERSHKSDHEVRHEADLKQAELLKRGDGDVDLVPVQTAQDFVDASTDEFNRFSVADRITEADERNDLKSLRRKLDRHLVLVMKQKVGDETHYLLPQGARRNGETLRETADRVVKETFGADLKVQIYGNAPTGVYKYKYPAGVREQTGSVGSKVFFYFGRHTGGVVPKSLLDYKWLDRAELRKELHPDYHDSMAQFLIDEN